MIDNYIKQLRMPLSQFQEPIFIKESAKKYLPKEIEPYRHMHAILVDLDKKLSPLRSIGMEYSLAIVGGAAYDTIVGCPTRDYDICMSIEAEYDYPMYTLQTRRAQPDIEAKIQVNKKAIRKILQQHYTLESAEQDKSYIGRYIEDVIKLGNIDLIVTGLNSKEFISHFDFNICKMKIDFDEELERFVDNFYIHPGAFYDLDRKTLTIAIDKFSDDEIDYFMTKHYKKLQEKLPGYSFNARSLRSTGRLEKILLQYNLPHALPGKSLKI